MLRRAERLLLAAVGLAVLLACTLVVSLLLAVQP